jgi:hypothetical protein
VPSSTSWRAEIDATDIEESLALSGELPFQFIRVIALAAGPRFFSILVPARPAIESMLHNFPAFSFNFFG